MSPVRAIPTSRAYWELKAEQVLNRVFEPEQPIEVEVCETPLTPAAGALRASQESAPPENPSSQPADPTTRTNTRLSTTSLPRWIQQLGRQPSLLLAGSSVSLMLLAALSLLILGSWNHSQQAIRQERNLGWKS